MPQSDKWPSGKGIGHHITYTIYIRVYRIYFGCGKIIKLDGQEGGILHVCGIAKGVAPITFGGTFGY